VRRVVGIDVGAETVKVAELQVGATTEVAWRGIEEHHKRPSTVLRKMLAGLDWEGVDSAAVTGRFARLIRLARVPTKEAQARGFRRLHGDRPATIVSIGSHGFSVLELRASGAEIFRENSRCSQGTGNFLRQLVERFELGIEEASALCEDVEHAAPLSGRCPVILKTDMTHLANKGEDRERIIAGLYDAVCENVQVLIKPRISPRSVLLCGGGTRSTRIRKHFRGYLERHGMELIPGDEEDTLLLEALGCALVAAERELAPPSLEELIINRATLPLERVPGLSESLGQVRRMQRRPSSPGKSGAEVVLGLDIGSTGSKGVALDPITEEIAWEGYRSTGGDPVGAAQALVREFGSGPAGGRPVVAFGVTGSGREIVGSLLATCYGTEAVFVLNEIAAHARGAHQYDPRVDTIFEIGGQDAKYIRLDQGRVTDAAMNEACSAGTGSFIEEQGRRFKGIRDVVDLGREALAAQGGVSLGQHCSVFMAEIIDEAVGAGVDSRTIIAGIYDSIIQNYLNRVKGSRSVGDVIFCQGMPFAADALAAAVAGQTGGEVIIPPNPGTVGALGIALLAVEGQGHDTKVRRDLSRFLEAALECKDTFVCKSSRGCGGSGNRCRIDRLRTVVGQHRHTFTWGGGCSLWDKGTGKAKLPDLAPDPFRQREALARELTAPCLVRRNRPTIGLTDEFALKSAFPFFATFLHELGFDLVVENDAGRSSLKRGIEEANVPFCAPMQLFRGVASRLADRRPDYLFLPMFRSTPRNRDETHAAVCPMVQAAPDLLRRDLGPDRGARIISPIVDFGEEGFDSKVFSRSCRRLAASLTAGKANWRTAFAKARDIQQRFESACVGLGADALRFAMQHDLVPLVVLGRPYTIYNDVLNSNVPAILREQGGMAVPVDCYPVGPDTPAYPGVFWGHGQRNLRAAKQIRDTDGIYSIWCSNYSCGPDSFNLHFYSYLMEGKPYAVIETDGHSGDAGTKTRVEAFLHCVRQDLELGIERERSSRDLTGGTSSLPSIRESGERLLLPAMGRSVGAFAACLRGNGVETEVMRPPDAEAVRLGRRYTSGKECLPMCVTLGSLLQRLETEEGTDQRFAFMMPRADGPCRFGVYNLLHTIVLERLGWQDRVSIWSPSSEDYFVDAPAGFKPLLFSGICASDMLQAALFDVRPVETEMGEAQAVYKRYDGELMEHLEREATRLPRSNALLQIASGELFGCSEILRNAARDFARIKGRQELPSVLVVGEIYLRLDAASNDHIIEQLEARGVRVRFAPVSEWFEYIDQLNIRNKRQSGLAPRISSIMQRRIQAYTYALMAQPLGWPPRTTVRATLQAGTDYLREDLWGEAILTIGGPVREHREGLVDGVVSVGPLECMPSKIAEAQLFHAAEHEALLSLTIPFNGDPLDPEILDTFVFAVKERFGERVATGGKIRALEKAPIACVARRLARICGAGEWSAGEEWCEQVARARTGPVAGQIPCPTARARPVATDNPCGSCEAWAESPRRVAGGRPL
jgi:predicted CoA-substrate-specific enzyme activase